MRALILTLALAIIVLPSLLALPQEDNLCANYWKYKVLTYTNMGESILSQVDLIFLSPVLAFVTHTSWATEINILPITEFEEPCPEEELPPILLGKMLPSLWPYVLFITVPVVKEELPPFSVNKLLLDLSSTLPWLRTPDLEGLVISLSSEGSSYLGGKKIHFRINMKVSSKGFESVIIGNSEFKALMLEHIIEIHPGTDYHIKSWWFQGNLFAPIKATGIIEPGVATRINFEWELINFCELSESQLINQLKIALEEMERSMPSKAKEVCETLRQFGIDISLKAEG